MKVLFGSQKFPEALRRIRKLVPEQGHELIICDEHDIAQYVGDVDVIIPTAIAHIDSQVLAQGHFGLVQQFGVGLDNIDIEAATHHGVWVARVPGALSGNAASVAEHALLFMLQLSRRIPEAKDSIAAKQVGTPLGSALLGKTVCIVGMGHIGCALAQRLGACGMKILAVDNHGRTAQPLPPSVNIERFFRLAELPDALVTADYIVLCLNYHQDLHNLFDFGLLTMVKPGAFLINVARGGLVNPDALLAALQDGHLAGAGLDVFWDEPVDPSHPLFQCNVIATPHIAGVTDVSNDGNAELCVENIVRYARGEKPLYTVNEPLHPRR